MPPQKDCLDDAPTVLTTFGTLETVRPQQTADLRVARTWEPELPCKRTHTSIDLGHRLARIVEEGERRHEPPIDPGRRFDHFRMIAARPSRV